MNKGDTDSPRVSPMDDSHQVIDMVESTDPAGEAVWVVPGDNAAASTSPMTIDGGAVRTGDQPVSTIPRERFATGGDPGELARMIQQIRDAEAGHNTAEIAVQPDGKITPSQPGQHQAIVSSVPRERFAAPPGADSAEIGRLDPHHVCGWRWHDSVRGWTFTMTPDVFGPSRYRFLLRREPARHNEWFAYCLDPNLDHLVGHRHHLQRLDNLTVVCLRPGFRGHPTLADAHGALAKWCHYIEFIRRGLAAPYSE